MGSTDKPKIQQKSPKRTISSLDKELTLVPLRDIDMLKSKDKPPTENELKTQAEYFINVACDIIFDLFETEEFYKEQFGTDESLTRKFWLSSQRKLIIAQSLIQQGAELMIKSLIAKESPYLLFDDLPVNKSSNYHQHKTIDASTLVKLHNKIFKNKIPDDFYHIYEKMRKQRNIYLHTADKYPKANFKNYKRHIFATLYYAIRIIQLDHERKWASSRLSYLNFEPKATFDSEAVMNEYLESMRVLAVNFNAKILKDLFSFKKSGKKYLCQFCRERCSNHLDYPEFYSAQMTPDGLFCFACRFTWKEIIKAKCPQTECSGTILIYSKFYTHIKIMCATCGCEWEKEHPKTK